MQAIIRKCFAGACDFESKNGAPDRAVILACPEANANEAEIRGQSRLTGCLHRLKLSTVREC